VAARAAIAWSRAQTTFALLATALLAGWHVVRALDGGPLWRDEAHVVNWASFPSIALVWGNRHLDAFPATWSLLVHAWVSLAGGSDTSLRALGAGVGIAGLATLWWTMRQLGARAPALVLVLYAANPVVLVFGDSVRGYGLGLAALTFFLGAVAAAVARPRWQTLALAQLAALLVAHTDFRNCVFVLAALVAAAAVAARRRQAKLAALILALGALPLLSLATYLPTFRSVSDWVAVYHQPVSYAYLFRIFSHALEAAGARVPQLFWLFVLLGAAACVREIVSPRAPIARDRALLLLITLAIAIPGTFVALASLRILTQIWYYQSLLCVMVICADGGLALRGPLCGESRWETGAKLALVGAAVALCAPVVWQTRTFRLTNVDAITAGLDREAASGDLVVVTPYELSASFGRYYAGAAPWITLPEVRDRRFQDPRSVKEKIGRADPIRAELDRIAATLAAGHRVWWVGVPSVPRPGTDPSDLPPGPDPRTGWYDVPYRTAWMAQAGAVLAREAGAIRLVVPQSEGAINRFENLPLYVADP
jgi:hypothetical protein